jgi:predicted acyl esterase
MAFRPPLRALTTLVLSALCSWASASDSDGPKAPAATAVAIRKTTVMVSMHDGVRLATDVYQLEPRDGPLPVIFTRGPYGKGGAESLSKAACPRGYVVVSQDMRGRHDSDGNDSVAFHNDGWGERRDGQDSLDWIAKQPWCNGRIGTHGGSALGITQTMLAPGAPDSLKAQWVFSAFSDMYSQCAYQGGAWRKSLIEAWLDANGFERKSRDTFLKHPRFDEFWAETNAEAEASRVNAPGVFLGGWYDIFLQGTINSFVTIQDHGGPGARGRCRLFVGPIGHGVFTYELTVDLWSTSLVFNKGHRIRVLVSSSNAPRFEPNPNTGRLPRADKEQRVATNTVRLSAEAPSHVLLPVYREPGPEGKPQ